MAIKDAFSGFSLLGGGLGGGASPGQKLDKAIRLSRRENKMPDALGLIESARKEAAEAFICKKSIENAILIGEIYKELIALKRRIISSNLQHISIPVIEHEEVALDCKNAISLLKRFEGYENNGKIRFLLAYLHTELAILSGDIVENTDLLKKALAFCPKYFLASRILGELALLQAQSSNYVEETLTHSNEAVEYSGMAIRANPDDYPSYNVRGQACFLLKRQYEAAADFKSAVEIIGRLKGTKRAQAAPYLEEAKRFLKRIGPDDST